MITDIIMKYYISYFNWINVCSHHLTHLTHIILIFIRLLYYIIQNLYYNEYFNPIYVQNLICYDDVMRMMILKILTLLKVS